jgi:hypothetical protein
MDDNGNRRRDLFCPIYRDLPPSLDHGQAENLLNILIALIDKKGGPVQVIALCRDPCQTHERTGYSSLPR